MLIQPVSEKCPNLLRKLRTKNAPFPPMNCNCLRATCLNARECFPSVCVKPVAVPCRRVLDRARLARRAHVFMSACVCLCVRVLWWYHTVCGRVAQSATANQSHNRSTRSRCACRARARLHAIYLCATSIIVQTTRVYTRLRCSMYICFYYTHAWYVCLFHTS